MDRTLDAVRSALVLQGLGETELRSLADSLEYQRVPAGRRIFEEGGPPDALFLLAEGRVALGRGERGEGGFARAVATLGAGDCFGELGVLLDHPRAATAVAETDVTLYRLSREAFDRAIARQDAAAVKLMRNLARELCRRLRALDRELDRIEDAGAGAGDVGALRRTVQE